jgi:hypothetical protein
MKNLVTTLCIITGLVLLLPSAGFAETHGRAQQSSREMARLEIIKNIACPEFISGNGQGNEVKAVVAVDESGRVSIDEINSNNPQLKEYVINQLRDMKLKNKGTNEKFVLYIKFQTA